MSADCEGLWEKNWIENGRPKSGDATCALVSRERAETKRNTRCGGQVKREGRSALLEPDLDK